jgi:hypothetical protein
MSPKTTPHDLLCHSTASAKTIEQLVWGCQLSVSVQVSLASYQTEMLGTDFSTKYLVDTDPTCDVSCRIFI